MDEARAQVWADQGYAEMVGERSREQLGTNVAAFYV